MKRVLLILVLTVSLFSVVAKRVEPYAGSRIFWDMRSQQQVFDDGWYARMIRLNDGRLLAASESGWNVIVSYSNDSGRTWSPQDTIFYPPEGLRYFDVDLCQLTDGKIIITYNIGFPDEKAPDGRFGVRLRISEDNGKTWSDDIFVYDGEREFENGTWEPNILELPSGELHLYVSDEAPYTHSGEQCIQLFRSTDKGYTWQGPETVSFRKGARDGMPTAVILGDSIVMAIEDNGWPGMESFVPVTVRTSLSDNWRSGVVGGDSPKRAEAIDYSYCPKMFGGAPYIRVLPSGETILSRQSYLKSGEYGLMNMFVYVGDKDGRGFKAMSQPFPDNLESRISIEVNSVSVVDSVVYALGGFMSGGTDNRRHVDIVKGYPFKSIRAFKGNATVDGIKGYMEYSSPDANQIKMGTNSLSHNVYADFNYDDKYLYFIAEVDDNTPEGENGPTVSKDGVRLLIDADNVSDDAPVKGMYEFFFPRKGNPESRKGRNDKWENFKAKGVICRCVSDDVHYVVEAAIPWRLLGKRHAPENQRMAVTI
ncbi:MAG: exo-alpha-sialidase, partial [Muribaculaceae bacterium]|nr:exo-alpha-sialidase [Muribaculaceae bacterium]